MAGTTEKPERRGRDGAPADGEARPRRRRLERTDSDEIRRVAERAIRRLDMLEYVILAAAAVMSLVAGALVAFLLSSAVGAPFRTTWIVASLVLFVVPAVTTWLRNREPDSPNQATEDERTDG